MLQSQNGWPVLVEDGSFELHEWVVPTREGDVTLPLRRGSAGFVLCHWALWFADNIEPVFGGGDDFGWAFRKIANSDMYSNHASGTAVDLNASKHPSGVHDTFTRADAEMIRARLLGVYKAAIRWGGDYRFSVDEMHFEINTGKPPVSDLAVNLVDTLRGRRILKVNRGQRRLIK